MVSTSLAMLRTEHGCLTSMELYLSPELYQVKIKIICMNTVNIMYDIDLMLLPYVSG